VKRSKRLTKRTTEEELEIKELIRHLGLDYFFIGVIKRLVHPPTVMTIFVLWNKEFNYYKNND
jgi:hypothetical protein